MEETLTATALVKKFNNFYTLENNLYEDLGFMIASLIRTQLNRLYLNLYFLGEDKVTSQIIVDMVTDNPSLHNLSGATTTAIANILKEYVEIILDIKALGKYFKLSLRKKHDAEPYFRNETYAANWDYITGLESTDIVKSTLFNFINSKLYRGEQLWILNVDAALSLLAFRNCSDEAQSILENSKGN